MTQRHFTHHLVALLALGAIACDRAPSGPPPRVARAKVTLGTIHHGDFSAPARVERGEAALEITRLAVVISDLELHTCAPPLQASLPFVREAHAHVPDSATRLGTPFVEDLLGRTGKALIIGEVAPPVGDFCELWVILAPADEDVMNLTELDTGEVVGESFLLKGRWRPRADAEWRPFSHALALKRAWRVELIDPREGTSPLSLPEDGDSAFILLDKRVDASLLDGMDFASLETPAGAEALADRLASRLKIYQRDEKTSP